MIMNHRIAPQAEADLDDIWLYVARESGSMEVASRLIDSITDRFCFLAGFPQAGRARDREFGAGVRSFPVGEYIVVYCVEGADVFILRVVHGRREMEKLFE
jgi:toxin ParE1/3/4